MPSTDVPPNLPEYLHARLIAQHANAHLVFVFDRTVRLALPVTIPAGGRTWHVVPYDGNDLAFRLAFLQLPASAVNRLIWVTGRRMSASSTQPIDISSLADLFAQADDWIDMSIAGVLATLIPNEVWPEAVLEEYADRIGANLPTCVVGHAKLRTLQGRNVALDAAGVRTLALHCSQPTIPVEDLIFQRDDATQLLLHYIRLAWRTDWDTQSRELLRRHVQLSASIPLGDVEPWLNTPLEELARYLYIRRFLSRHRIPQIANQMRGLGILGFDPEPLEKWVDQVLARWDREPDWGRQIVTGAEESLSLDDLARVAKLLPSATAGNRAVLSTVEGPGLFVQIAAAMLQGMSSAALDAALAAWSAERPLTLAALPETRHTPAARAMSGFLDEGGSVIATLAQGLNPSPELAGLIDWYVQGGFYDLEYAVDRAKEHARKLATSHGALSSTLTGYLGNLRGQVRTFLRHADLELANRLRANWGQYLNNPRLATNILSDLIKRKRIRPTVDQCLWFVVFDGMRWDTWQHIVKPRLLELFELTKPETPYLSMLPSWTMVARTALLTGQQPQYWGRRPDRQSVDQAALAAHAFGIPPANTNRDLRFISNLESDRHYEQLDPAERYPWNVLIFNISDDNLHKEKGSLSMLNGTIRGYMDSIVHTLSAAVRPGDLLLVSSDHGFMELDDDGVVIRDEARWQLQGGGSADPVRYRYLLGMKNAAGYAFDLPGFTPPEFTVAISQTWFKRSDDRRRPDRYAHGGLSLAEMVVPGALLQRIVEKKTAIVLEDLPAQVHGREGDPITINVAVRNTGNQPGRFRLSMRCSNERMPQSFTESLAPGEKRSLTVRLGPAVGAPAYVELLFSHQDLQGNWLPERRTDITLHIERRTDVVELQFGGLDDLDAL